MYKKYKFNFLRCLFSQTILPVQWCKSKQIANFLLDVYKKKMVIYIKKMVGYHIPRSRSLPLIIPVSIVNLMNFQRVIWLIRGVLTLKYGSTWTPLKLIIRIDLYTGTCYAWYKRITVITVLRIFYLLCCILFIFDLNKWVLNPYFKT